MQKSFIWHDSSSKIKYETLKMEFKAGGLKNVHKRFTFVSFQYSSVKKLCDDCFHEWKIIPLDLHSKYFGPFFKFHSSLHFESKLSKYFYPFQAIANEFEKIFHCTSYNTFLRFKSVFMV